MKKIKILLGVFSFVFAYFLVANAQSVCVYGTPGCGVPVQTTVNQNYTNINTQVTTQLYPELCSVLSRTMKYGTRGQDVRRLQVVLGQEGIAYLNATGVYGYPTMNAVKVFQRRNGITPTGNVGPYTLASMQSLWCGGGNTNPTYPNPISPIYGQPEISLAPVSSSGANLTLGWTTKNVSSCTLQQDNLPTQAVETNGSRTINMLGESVFTLTCSTYNGSQMSKRITVRPNQTISNLPTVTAYINPTQVLVGSQATVYWNAQNANYCTTNWMGGNQQTNGSYQFTVTQQNQSFTITCFGQNNLSSSVTVYASGQTNPTTINDIVVLDQNAGTVTLGIPTCNISSGRVVWGDNTANTTFMNENQGCILRLTHVYTTGGDYTVYVQDLNGATRYSKQVRVVLSTVNNGVSLNLSLNKTSFVNGETFTMTSTFNNNTGNSIVINMPTPCSEIAEMNIDSGSAANFFGIIYNTCAQVITPVTIPAGGTRVTTFTGTIKAVSGQYPNHTGSHTASSKVLYGSNYINSNTVGFTVSDSGTTGGPTVTVSNSNPSVGSTQNISWNFSCGTYSPYAGNCQSPQGVKLDLIRIEGGSETNLGAIRIVRDTTAVSGSYNWIIPNFSANGNNNISCPADLADLCEASIKNGTYKIRASFFTPSNMCFGYCINNGTILKTVDSGTFTLYSNNTGGAISLSISANPTNVTSGQSSTITLNGSGTNVVSGCTISGGIYNNSNFPVYTTGSNYAFTGTMVVYPTTTTTYNLNCNNSVNGQSGTGSVTVYVNGGNNGNVSVNVSAYPTNVTSGQSSTLTWSSTNATVCNLVGNNSTIVSNQSPSGSYIVYPTQNTNYVVNCYNQSGQNASAFVYVTVNNGGTNPSISASAQAGRLVTIYVYNYCGAGGVIEWGDGTRAIPTDTSCTLVLSHTYATTGNYVISLTRNNVVQATASVYIYN